MGVRTVPPDVDIASTETVGIAIDMTDAIVAGETVTAPTSSLIDETTGAAYAAGLSGTPSVVGNVITQKVTALVKGKSYRLIVSFTAAAGIVKSRALVIGVPY